MDDRLPRALAVAVLALAFATSVALYPSLPAEMATHWNAAGGVDGTMAKPLGAFAVPAIAAFVLALLFLVPRIDPRGENIAAFRGAYDWFVAGVMAFLAYVHGLVLLWNLGVAVPVGRAIALPLAGFIYGVGVLLEHARPNWFVGIRTPWTLSDDEVWAETHDRGALAFKLAGVLALGGVVLPEFFLVFVLAPLLLASAYAVGYSFVAYRRKHDTA